MKTVVCLPSSSIKGMVIKFVRHSKLEENWEKPKQYTEFEKSKTSVLRVHHLKNIEN